QSEQVRRAAAGAAAEVYLGTDGSRFLRRRHPRRTMSGASRAEDKALRSAADGLPAAAIQAAGEADAAEWMDFVRRTSGAELYHDYRWRSLIREVFGHETHYLMARDAEGVL